VVRALAGIVSLIGVLLGGILFLGFSWATVVLEAGVISCLVIVERRGLPVAKRWSRGAAGEERVGNILDGLRDHGWFTLHDVHLGRGNTDHVVLGPAGIYAIETKSHRGRIDTGHIDTRMLKQAYAEAKCVEQITGLRTEPMLVFSHAYLIPAVSHRDGVVILPARMLARYLRERGGTIPPRRVHEVYERLAAALPA
jgi:Nuclease-related domain